MSASGIRNPNERNITSRPKHLHHDIARSGLGNTSLASRVPIPTGKTATTITVGECRPLVLNSQSHERDQSLRNTNVKKMFRDCSAGPLANANPTFGVHLSQNLTTPNAQQRSFRPESIINNQKLLRLLQVIDWHGNTGNAGNTEAVRTLTLPSPERLSD